MPYSTTASPRDRRVLAAVMAMAATGVASLGLAPLEKALPEGVDLPRAALLVQPALLAAAFAIAGWWAAPRAGLRLAIIEGALAGESVIAKLRTLALPSLLVGLAGAVLMLGYGYLTAPAFAGVAAPEIPLATRLLYGGMTEEILARWGVLSLLMVGAMKLGLGKSQSFWLANVLAAVVFGIGHFGLLFSVMQHPPLWLVAAVLVGNALPALAFGWLYRWHGLESAMLAHSATHLFAAILSA